jgi:lipopolysaccharide export system protein LptA
MTPRLLHWPILLTAASLAAAPKPGARPDDAAALEDAIRAVDRAAEKNDEPKKAAGGESAAKPAKPAKPTKPAPDDPAATPTRAAADAPRASAPAPASRTGTEAAKPKPSSPAVTQTRITGLEDAELDNARNVIIFRKNVVVDRADLKIWCDSFEIALNRGGAPKSAKPAGEVQPSEEPDALSAQSIKSATATGSSGGLVVIWRKTGTGEVVAVGRKAVYNASDGTFTITGRPEVLNNMTEYFHSQGEADKLTLFKNGSARGMKKVELNLNDIRAREIRQRLFSHVPARPAGDGDEAAVTPADRGLPPPVALPLPPAATGPGN